MKSAQYLVRFDDVCPSMDWVSWGAIEEVLDRRRVCPVLAVVPDNRDPKLEFGPPRDDFWQRVRTWQAKGWSIGLHGYQHLYESKCAGLVGLNDASEFAGLPEFEQAAKLDAALDVFSREKIRADCWIAPGHSFDRATVRLLRDRGITTISDGYFRRPVEWMSCTWVPQQLWRFRTMPSGTWTVCFHHNGFDSSRVSRLDDDLGLFQDRLISLRDAIVRPVRARTMFDAGTAIAWRTALRIRRRARS